MIQEALQQLASSLNIYFHATLPVTEDIVVLTPPIQQDGSVTPFTQNKILLSLLNIVPESSRNALPVGHSGNPIAMPPQPLKLQVIFTANFGGSNYSEGLKLISAVISYLLSHPVFTVATGTTVTLAPLALSLTDMATVCKELGVSYQPSLVYELRGLLMERTQNPVPSDILVRTPVK